jgi:hypothetical protein
MSLMCYRYTNPLYKKGRGEKVQSVFFLNVEVTLCVTTPTRSIKWRRTMEASRLLAHANTGSPCFQSRTGMSIV